MLSRDWQKSSRSQTQGQCVELRRRSGAVQLRDSKLGDTSPVFDLDPASYASFLASLGRRR